MNKQNNGNEQLNLTRNELNKRIKSKLFLGQSTRVKLNDHRRYRTI